MQGNFSEPEKQGSLYSALKLYRKNGLTAINTLFGAYNNIRECQLLSCQLLSIVVKQASSSVRAPREQLGELAAAERRRKRFPFLASAYPS